VGRPGDGKSRDLYRMVRKRWPSNEYKRVMVGHTTRVTRKRTTATTMQEGTGKMRRIVWTMTKSSKKQRSRMTMGITDNKKLRRRKRMRGKTEKTKVEKTRQDILREKGSRKQKESSKQKEGRKQKEMAKEREKKRQVMR
jgi:hypothetical protein